MTDKMSDERVQQWLLWAKSRGNTPITIDSRELAALCREVLSSRQSAGVREAVIEECARVADDHWPATSQPVRGPSAAAGAMARRIAAAIRALNPKEPSG